VNRPLCCKYQCPRETSVCLVSQNFPAFFGTWMFINVLVTAGLTLNHMNGVHRILTPRLCNVPFSIYLSTTLGSPCAVFSSRDSVYVTYYTRRVAPDLFIPVTLTDEYNLMQPLAVPCLQPLVASCALGPHVTQRHVC
jgi:hypothetical protein